MKPVFPLSPLNPPKPSNQFGLGSICTPFTFFTVPETFHDCVIVEVDDANISSSDEEFDSSPRHIGPTPITGLPKPCIPPLIPEKSVGDTLFPQTSPTPPLEFTSTNGSIGQVPDPPVESRESLSPDPPVHVEFIDTHSSGPNEFSPPSPEMCDGTAQIPQKTATPFVAVAGVKEENVTEMSVIFTNKGIHENMISHPDLKMLFVKHKEKLVQATTATAMDPTTTHTKINKVVVIHDFKEGTLEKGGAGILGSWKAKYCRASSGQFVIFKNVQTGFVSGVIDFKRVCASLKTEPPASGLIFTYAFDCFLLTPL